MLSILKKFWNLFKDPKPVSTLTVWKAGDEALCIKDGIKVNKGGAKKDEKYIVKAVRNGCIHSPVLLDISIIANNSIYYSGCGICKKSFTDGIFWCCSYNFVKINK